MLLLSCLFCLVFVSSSVLLWVQGGVRLIEKIRVFAVVLSTDQVLISHEMSGFFLFFLFLGFITVGCLNFPFRVKLGAMSSLQLMLPVTVESWNKVLFDFEAVLQLHCVIFFFGDLPNIIYQSFSEMTAGFICLYNCYILLSEILVIFRFQEGRVDPKWGDGLNPNQISYNVSCFRS